MYNNNMNDDNIPNSASQSAGSASQSAGSASQSAGSVEINSVQAVSAFRDCVSLPSITLPSFFSNEVLATPGTVFAVESNPTHSEPSARDENDASSGPGPAG